MPLWLAATNSLWRCEVGANDWRPTYHAIIDLDDTLLFTGRIYREHEERFLDVMEQQGFNRSLAKLFFEEIDREAAIASPIFERDRFPNSMVATLNDAWQRRYGEPAPESLQKWVYIIGWSVYTDHAETIPGAREFLATLLHWDWGTHIWTHGHEATQKWRIRRAGFDELLTSINVEGRKKDPESLRSLLAQQRIAPYYDTVMVIGDSRRAEISAAVDLGLAAIWMPPENEWDHAGVALEDTHYRRAATFDDALWMLRSFMEFSTCLHGDRAVDHYTSCNGDHIAVWLCRNCQMVLEKVVGLAMPMPAQELETTCSS